jgi:hypothetical protein
MTQSVAAQMRRTLLFVGNCSLTASIDLTFEVCALIFVHIFDHSFCLTGKKWCSSDILLSKPITHKASRHKIQGECKK